MIDKMSGPELFEQAVSGQNNALEDGDGEVLNQIASLLSAQVTATNAQTAAILALVDAVGEELYEMDAWRDVIPRPPLKDCKGKEARRPQCAERHTDDCAYADPVPEPKHELLPVGTRVLVSNPHDTNCGCSNAQPWVGKIAGYDLYKSKYQINEERRYQPGEYYSYARWVFADNRVQAHPDRPEYTPPQPVKTEPTGPRMYVQNHHGKQGHVVDVSSMNGELMFRVQWYSPGTAPVWKAAGSLTIIPADEVDRCLNGQTGDECGSGENQCESCRQAEDAEADTIERSMGL